MINILWLIPLGWGLGAMVNYLADVLPRTRRFSAPVCPRCEEGLPWHYTLWPKKCQACGEKRLSHARGGSTDPSGAESRGSADPLRAKAQRNTVPPRSIKRAWVVLILGAAATLGLWHYPSTRLGFAGGLAWSVYFGLVVVIDVEHRLILHPVSWVGAVLGAGFGFSMHGLWPTVWGGMAGFGIMLGLYYLGELFLKLLIRIRGEETDEVPLGFGDVNLAGVIGLLLGWPGITAGLVLAILIGGVVSGLFLVGSLLTRRYQAYTALPYGPFLAASALFLLFR